MITCKYCGSKKLIFDDPTTVWWNEFIKAHLYITETLGYKCLTCERKFYGPLVYTFGKSQLFYKIPGVEEMSWEEYLDYVIKG